MKAPAGSVVSLYVDLDAKVEQGHVIQTGTGRSYGVLFVRTQERGKRAGRQHLRCVVLGPDDELGRGTVIHVIRWYKR